MYQDPVDSCANRLRQALSIRHMTQSELCKQTKIASSMMSEYLKGKYEPKQDKVYLLSKALRVDPAWLMGFDVPMESENKISPDEEGLTEREKMMLELFRKIPEDRQDEALDLLRVALKMQQRP